MTHGDAHGHAEHEPKPVSRSIFPEAEWVEFEKEDKTAATMVTGLMAGIFTIGLLLYLGVCIVVAT